MSTILIIKVLSVYGVLLIQKTSALFSLIMTTASGLYR